MMSATWLLDISLLLLHISTWEQYNNFIYNKLHLNNMFDKWMIINN